MGNRSPAIWDWCPWKTPAEKRRRLGHITEARQYSAALLVSGSGAGYGTQRFRNGAVSTSTWRCDGDGSRQSSDGTETGGSSVLDDDARNGITSRSQKFGSHVGQPRERGGVKLNTGVFDWGVPLLLAEEFEPSNHDRSNATEEMHGSDRDSLTWNGLQKRASGWCGHV